MEIILLERVPKLGVLGDVVTVKAGYARNYLLPHGKALRSTPADRAVFEKRRLELAKTSEQSRALAEKDAEKLSGKSIVQLRAASEKGQLYGSVTARDIAKAITEQLHVPARHQMVTIIQVMKTTGVFMQSIRLHPEVEIMLGVNIAISDEEGEKQHDAWLATLA